MEGGCLPGAGENNLLVLHPVFFFLISMRRRVLRSEGSGCIPVMLAKNNALSLYLRRTYTKQVMCSQRVTAPKNKFDVILLVST